MIESLEIDPLDSNHWLYGTGMTIFGGHDLTNWDTIHNVTIQSLADGIEETSVQGLASAPGGSELLAAVGDDNGYTFTSANNLGTSPQNIWSTPTWTTSTSVDYAGNSVKNVVRVGNTAGTQQVAISSDGGVTWNIDYGADTNMNGGTVAYSANADTILWSTGSTGVKRSQYQVASRLSPVCPQLPSSPQTSRQTVSSTLDTPRPFMLAITLAAALQLGRSWVAQPLSRISSLTQPPRALYTFLLMPASSVRLTRARHSLRCPQLLLTLTRSLLASAPDRTGTCTPSVPAQLATAFMLVRTTAQPGPIFKVAPRASVPLTAPS